MSKENPLKPNNDNKPLYKIGPDGQAIFDGKINDFGEIIRDGKNIKKEFPAALSAMIEYEGATKQGSTLPFGKILENGASNYYKEHHISGMKEIIEKIKKIAKENNLTHLMNWDESQGISIDEAINQIQKNINFSEKINAEIKENPIIKETQWNEEELEKKREQLRNKLRGI